MKDEVREKIINRFVGLKSKNCSLIAVDGEGIKKAKDINKNVVQSIRHKEYANVLFVRGLARHNMKRIQSKRHRTGTCDVFKVSFSCFVDKRCILDHGISCFAYFQRDLLD